MYTWNGQKLLRGCAVLALFALLLIFPDQSIHGIGDGLVCCAQQIIPALFPFFVVTQLILSDSSAHILGLAVSPLTHAWGIRDSHAPTALLLGWLGGFAVAARCISQLYEERHVSKTQAEFLLICAVGSSPAFVLNTVGLLMLFSRQAGFLLLAAQLLANIACGFVLRPFFHFTDTAAHTSEPFSTTCNLPQAIQSAISCSLTVCGFVIFFRALAAIFLFLVPNSHAVQFTLNALLEVTGGCQAGASLAHGKLYACCAALSVQGLSVLMQVRALAAQELSLRPLLLARILHLPLSIVFLHLLLHLWPVPAQVYSSLAPRVLTRIRAPIDVAFLLFLFCCFVLQQLNRAAEANKKR